MSRQNITEKIWYDPDVKNYIMLDITKDIEQQKPLVIDGVELLPKDEYHCSLVPVGKLSDDPDAVARIVSDIKDYLAFTPDSIRFDGFMDKYFVCKKEDETTLIVEAKILGLGGLRKIVQQTISDYQPTFPHVTLLKSENSPYGIGINSNKDLKTYCRRIDI